MENAPLISVIVPCYNQAQYLDECLQSVLDQTYQDWECIIVNDGSPDNTEEVAKAWTEKDSRFIYLYKENGGLSSARNAGIEMAKGEWIQFLDCDDKIDKEKFEASKYFFFNNDIIISDYQLFSKEGYLLSYCDFKNEDLHFENILINWDINFTIPIHCALFKKKNIPNFDTSVTAKEDWLFWLNLFEKKINYVILKRKLAFYRMHSDSMTKKNLDLIYSNELKVYLKIYENINDELKKQFFESRIAFKNNQLYYFVNSYNKLIKENNKLNNSQLMKFRKKIYKMFHI